MRGDGRSPCEAPSLRRRVDPRRVVTVLKSTPGAVALGVGPGAPGLGGVPEQGEIVREPDDGILVRYIYPTYSAGHFVHAGDGAGACPR